MPLPVAALILAAGSATRMGRLKQLLPLGDRPVLRHGIDTLREAGIADITVVCGADPGPYRSALGRTGARLVANTAEASEMAESVRRGLAEIDLAACSGVLVWLADHPLVLAETCRTLLRLHGRSPDRIIIPAFQGRRGHPVLFPVEAIAAIFAKPSLRDIVRQDPRRVIVADVPDEGVVLDMDTAPDYEKAVGLFGKRSRDAGRGTTSV